MRDLGWEDTSHIMFWSTCFSHMLALGTFVWIMPVACLEAFFFYDSLCLIPLYWCSEAAKTLYSTQLPFPSVNLSFLGLFIMNINPKKIPRIAVAYFQVHFSLATWEPDCSLKKKKKRPIVYLKSSFTKFSFILLYRLMVICYVSLMFQN